MSRIVIIGNGKKALNSKKKEFIDESIVIRMNNFKTVGFEEYVGTRTDIYSCAPRYIEFIDLTDEQRSDICKQNLKDSLVRYKHGFTEQEIEERKESFFRIHTPPKVESAKLSKILFLFTNDKSKIQSYPFTEKIRVSDVEFDQNYSTGLRTILYCLSHFKTNEIFITGFDNFLLSGWYWDDKFNIADKYIRTANYTDGHPYLVERQMMKELIRNKTITEI
jgi:hypothetical protein